MLLIRDDLSTAVVADAWATGSLGFAYRNAGSEKPAKTAAYMILNKHLDSILSKMMPTKMKNAVLWP